MVHARCGRLCRLVAITAIAVAAAACAAGSVPDLRAAGPARPLPEKGELSSTSLQEFRGMLAGAEGRPVVVNVWASWCAPCRTEAPLLQRAAQTYAGRVVFIGVDSKDALGSGRDFLGEFEISYPNVFDDTGDIRGWLRLRGFPTTYVFGGDGRLRTQVVGGIREQELVAQLEDALRS